MWVPMYMDVTTCTYRRYRRGHRSPVAFTLRETIRHIATNLLCNPASHFTPHTTDRGRTTAFSHTVRTPPSLHVSCICLIVYLSVRTFMRSDRVAKRTGSMPTGSRARTAFKNTIVFICMPIWTSFHPCSTGIDSARSVVTHTWRRASGGRP